MRKLFRLALLVIALSFPVYAGHSRPGGEYCTCGCTGCVCDPGEPIGACTNAPVRQPKETDFGSLALLLIGIGGVIYRITFK